MGRKKTHEEFMKEFYEKNPNAKNIEILGKYEGRKVKILCMCKIDNYKWHTTPNGLLGSKNIKPNGCPKCAGKIKKTHKQFIEEMNEINPNIKILGHYIDAKTKIECECKIDGYKWEAEPTNLLQKKGCPKCAGKIPREHDDFVKELNNINPNIKIIGKFISTRTKIECECKIDGYKWEAEPRHLLGNHGCPKCNDSIGEKITYNILNKLNIKNIRQYKFKDCKFYKCLPFDFYLPQYNCCIEIDGKQHENIVKWFGGLDGFIDRKIRDTVKDIYCKNNGIKLIRITYKDINEIEKIICQELNLN